jgi:hypothetical protein
MAGNGRRRRRQHREVENVVAEAVTDPEAAEGVEIFANSSAASKVMEARLENLLCLSLVCVLYPDCCYPCVL